MANSNEQFSFTLPKSERLTSKKEIDALFQQGDSIKSFPLKIIIQKNTTERLTQPKILVSVPKKKFKLAKDRNLLKRRIKEAYRLNKHLLNNVKISSIGIIYVSNRTESFNFIQEKLILAFDRLITDNQM